jgi:hypothetical protein
MPRASASFAQMLTRMHKSRCLNQRLLALLCGKMERAIGFEPTAFYLEGPVWSCSGAFYVRTKTVLFLFLMRFQS